MAPDTNRVTAEVIGRIGERKAVLKLDDGTTRDLVLPKDAFASEQFWPGAVMALELDEFGRVIGWSFSQSERPAPPAE